ncbi:hypothetical protein GTA08_BOTSDO12679 [Botryosphaeria dothidea]|uniref:Uncharacterized protein n=1 Tax=Botryosphaeria dothidea TaxID=55169 RepID=A0A8H4J4B6_9PEZI|nr:hypothetical protein GTA08_BOTSDO12679 [Botryosphaeria dothidea]
MTAPTADLVIHTYLRVPVKGSDAAPVCLLLGGVHPYDNLHRPSSVSMSAANKEANFTSTSRVFTGRCIGTTQPAHNGYEPRQEINNQPAAAMEGRRADCDVHAITEAIQHSIRLHAPSSLAALVRLVSQRLESHYGISRSIRELFDRTVLLLYGMRPAQQPVARTPRPAPPKDLPAGQVLPIPLRTRRPAAPNARVAMPDITLPPMLYRPPPSKLLPVLEPRRRPIPEPVLPARPG